MKENPNTSPRWWGNRRRLGRSGSAEDEEFFSENFYLHPFQIWIPNREEHGCMHVYQKTEPPASWRGFCSGKNVHSLNICMSIELELKEKVYVIEKKCRVSLSLSLFPFFVNLNFLLIDLTNRIQKPEQIYSPYFSLSVCFCLCPCPSCNLYTIIILSVCIEKREKVRKSKSLKQNYFWHNDSANVNSLAVRLSESVSFLLPFLMSKLGGGRMVIVVPSISFTSKKHHDTLWRPKSTLFRIHRHHHHCFK